MTEPNDTPPAKLRADFDEQPAAALRVLVHDAINREHPKAGLALAALDVLAYRAGAELPRPVIEGRPPLSRDGVTFRDQLLASLADVTVDGGPLDQRTTVELEQIDRHVRRAQLSLREQHRQTVLDMYHQRWCEVYAGIVAQLAPNYWELFAAIEDSPGSLEAATRVLANRVAIAAGVLTDEALKVEIDRTTRGPR